jgi:O-antigen/teichoic acid export membrane protein
VSLVAVFVLAEAVLLVAGVYQALLIGFDDIFGFLVCTVAGQLLTIALTRWLVVSDGGMGVGMAFLAGNAVILIATAFRLLSRHDATRVVTPVMPLVIALGAAAAAGWWATQASGPAPVWRAAVYLVACGVALAFLRPEERRWMIRPWRAPASARAR